MGCGCSKTNGTHTPQIYPGDRRRLTILADIPDDVVDPHGHSSSNISYKNYQRPPPNASPQIPKNTRVVDPQGYGNPDLYVSFTLTTYPDQVVDTHENISSMSYTHTQSQIQFVSDFPTVDPQGNYSPVLSQSNSHAVLDLTGRMSADHSVNLAQSHSHSLLHTYEKDMVINPQGNLSPNLTYSQSQSLLNTYDKDMVVDPQGNLSSSLSHSQSLMQALGKDGLLDKQGKFISNLSPSNSQSLFQTIEEDVVLDPQGNLTSSNSKPKLDHINLPTSHHSSRSSLPPLFSHINSDFSIAASKSNTQTIIQIVDADSPVL
jgi:hypothetical protein